MSQDTLAATGTVRGVFFSLGTTPAHDPQFDCAAAVVALFNQAQKTAHVAIYSLTEPSIVNAMIAAHKRGVQVGVVADQTESKNATMAAMIKKLTQAGVNIRVAVRQKALMHNKIGIFDSKTVCLGSFNWTTNAEKNNDENLMIVDGPEVATAYEKYVYQRILTNETLVEPA
jgi:phosphatidylserine/phosphatidylglycerophosphate/cardiolipin synthase-like enzyme